MNVYKKIFVMIILPGLIIFFGSFDAYAQFGLGQQYRERAEPKSLSAPGGRYVFGQISESDKDKFMLDTHTGRLWQIAESGEVGLFLREVPYRIGDGKYEPLPKRLTESESKEAAKE